MIPSHNQSGVLPPFYSGMAVSQPGAMAPYKCSLIQVVEQFAITPERIQILKGFIEYRMQLKHLGIIRGVQWIDGSFSEQVETTRGRPPNDIDVVTFFYRPKLLTAQESWDNFFHLNSEFLSNPEYLKTNYLTDGYHVDISINPIYLINQTSYWFGLFSHQKETYLWKGLIELKLEEDDSEAKELLGRIENNVSATSN
ncbi:MAG: hypothetical protein ORN21_01195 [Methylophilaceae bacterium]|nr:hypothetical protein [Methylophilaceae bacterium]